MKLKLTFLIIFINSVAWAQSDEVRIKHYNLTKHIAIEGYDPVSYFNNKPKKGNAEIQFSHHEVIYLFASEQNLAKFKTNPDQYEPAYGGWCAYAMGETGEKVKIDPLTFKIADGKLYLFYNFWGNNTLNDWNKNEVLLKTRADQQWKKYLR